MLHERWGVTCCSICTTGVVGRVTRKTVFSEVKRNKDFFPGYFGLFRFVSVSPKFQSLPFPAVSVSFRISNEALYVLPVSFRFDPKRNSARFAKPFRETKACAVSRNENWETKIRGGWRPAPALVIFDFSVFAMQSL